VAVPSPGKAPSGDAAGSEAVVLHQQVPCFLLSPLSLRQGSPQNLGAAVPRGEDEKSSISL